MREISIKLLKNICFNHLIVSVKGYIITALLLIIAGYQLSPDRIQIDIT